MAIADEASPALQLDAEDLRLELRTLKHLKTTQELKTERCILEAADERRKLEIRLAVLEPLYQEMYEEHLETLRNFEELEEALQKKDIEIMRNNKRHSVLLNEAEKESRSLNGKLKAVQIELATIRNTTKSSAADLVKDRDKAVSDLTDMQMEHQLLKERSKMLEIENEAAKSAKAKAVSKLEAALAGQADTAALAKKLESLQTKFAKSEQESLRLKEESLRSKEKSSQLNERCKELEFAIAEAKKSQATEKKAAQREEKDSAKALAQEITELKALLKTETKAREKSEQELSKARDEWEAKQKVFATKLEKAKAKLKAATSGSGESRKRSIGAALNPPDFERSVKKPRTTSMTAISNFSLTPFLQRNSAIGDETSTTIDTPTGGNDATVIAARTERSILIDTTEPKKLLLAGANRKRKPVAKVAPQSLIAEEVDDEEPTMEEQEASFLAPPPPKPKSKTKVNGKKPATATQKRTILSLSPPPGPVEKTKKPVKKKKQVGEASFLGGIRPTLFDDDDDDGSGRLEIDFNESGPSQKGNGKGTKLVPMTSAFNRDISPAKKRPAALKKMFGAKN